MYDVLIPIKYFPNSNRKGLLRVKSSKIILECCYKPVVIETCGISVRIDICR